MPTRPRPADIAVQNECRKDFSVTMARSWSAAISTCTSGCMAFYLLCSSKKGIRTHQLHRSLGIDYKSAWFMSHRIREACATAALRRWAARARSSRPMRRTTAGSRTPTPYAAQMPTPTKGGKVDRRDKRAIVALVERGGTCSHIPSRNADRRDSVGDRAREHRTARAACTPMKAASTSRSARVCGT